MLFRSEIAPVTATVVTNLIGACAVAAYAGVAGGVVSGKMMGKVQFMMGSVTVKFEGSPAVRLSDPTQHNEGNMVGAVLAPSQSVVMVMS